MIFKLKFHTSTTTLLEPYEIMARIQLELKDKKYKVEYVTGKAVSFKQRPGFRWNFEPTTLDGGEFTIGDNADSEQLLNLNYYYDYAPPLFIFVAFIVILLFQGEYEGIAFFAVFFGVTVPIDILRSRGKARELIAAILQADA